MAHKNAPVKHLLCSLILACLSYPLHAQISAHLEYRPRFILKEYLPAAENQNTSHIAFITQRSRAGLHWNSPHLEAIFTIQDVRYWGGENVFDTRGVYGHNHSLGVHNAYFILKMGSQWQWRIGRQLLHFDDERLLSLRNWNDYQVSYDALRLSFRNTKIEMDVVLSYNSDNNKTNHFPEQKYRTFNYLRVGRREGRIKYSLSSLLSGKSLSDTTASIRYLNTWSTYLHLNLNKRSRIEGSAHYQFNPGVNGQAHSAYCLSALLSLGITEKNRIKFGIDCLSGNKSEATNGINRAFDLHFGKRHGFYGLMDFYNTLPEQGLIDIFAQYEHHFQGGSSLQLHLHSFQLENKYKRDDNEHQGQNMGVEADIVANYRINELTRLQAGYGLYLDTPLSRQLKKTRKAGAGLPQFCYLLIELKIPLKPSP